MPTKKKDSNADADQKKYIAEKEYQYAISLMQYATTLLWQQFGVFMLVETIIIGYLRNELSNDNHLFVIVGSILGFFICILWGSTYEHNHKAYLLRMEQAKRHEKVLGFSLFTEGGDQFRKSKIPLWLRPHIAFRLLIWSFGILFFVMPFLAILYK